jgi:anti-sigma factor RsiW
MRDPGREPGDRAEAPLWQRWREATPASDIVMPDPLLVAAYAEGRLDETEAEPVEAWLADHPAALDDIIAARAAAAGALPEAPDDLADRAAELVAGSVVVPFPTRIIARRRTWRTAVAWSGIAASLLATSLVGFAIGNDTYFNFAGQPQAGLAAESVIHELLDPPGGLFMADEEPAT